MSSFKSSQSNLSSMKTSATSTQSNRKPSNKNKTKQQSITSFFSPTPRAASAANNTNTPTSTRTAPSVTPSARHKSTATTPTSASQKRTLLEADPSSALRRTLFIADDDAPLVSASTRKRRRLVRMDESDEDDDEHAQENNNNIHMEVDFADEEEDGKVKQTTDGNETKKSSISKKNSSIDNVTPSKQFGSSFQDKYIRQPRRGNVSRSTTPSKHKKGISTDRNGDENEKATNRTIKTSAIDLPSSSLATKMNEHEDEASTDLHSRSGISCINQMRLTRDTQYSAAADMDDSHNKDTQERTGEIKMPDYMRNLIQPDARDKLVELSGDIVQVGQEAQGWCSKHNWTVDIRDEQKRRPSDPNYDKSTLYIPPSELSGGSKTLTPFQKQFWEIKCKNYDVVVFFKKGKFYELYDIDADIGNTVLGLNFTKGGRVDMRCCGVPEQAFAKHAIKLIDLSYKVGRVEQTETANAAEKRKMNNSNTPSVCGRSLVRILTKGTIREEELLRGHHARYVVAVTDENILPNSSKVMSKARRTQVQDTSINSSDETVLGEDEEGSAYEETTTIGLCFIDVAAGGINIRQFHDDDQFGRTERLMTYLAPHEIIYDSSSCSDRLASIVKWCSQKFNSEVKDMGLKGKPGFKPVSNNALEAYLRNDNSHSENNDEVLRRLQSHTNKYPVSSHAFGAVVAHLKSLIIDKEVLSLGSYNLYPDPDTNGSHQDENKQRNVRINDSNMDVEEQSKTLLTQDDNLIMSTGKGNDRLYMDASALENLEVLTSTLGTEKGSLLRFIDRSNTPAGRRLLRKWLAEPLSCSATINDRLDAIEDLHMIEDADGGRLLQRISKLLRSKKDLERALPKLHQFATVSDGAVMFDDTNKRRVKEFVQVLRSVEDNLSACESLLEALEQNKNGTKSKRLRWLCTPGAGIPNDALDKLSYFLGEAFDLNSAENNGEIVPKTGAVPSYDEAKSTLSGIESQLEKELNKWKQVLNDRTIKYHHRGKEPYQLEIKRDTIKKPSFQLPNEFDVTSESKSVQRFYTSKIRSLVRKHVTALEDYENESQSIARNMASKFDENYMLWSLVSKSCSEIDALIGLSKTSRLNDGYSMNMTRPTILPNDYPSAKFEAESLKHPILIEQNNSQNKEFIPNDVKLGHQSDTDIMILTGPNAGGKSTLSRQVGLAVILAQIGCFVPADKLTLRPFNEIFVRMGASDEIARGRSTFMVEMEEVSRMLNSATDRSLIIADEVGRGTSTHDGFSIATQVVEHFAKINRSLAIFSTHYSRLADDVVNTEFKLKCQVYEMAARVDERNKSITFLYKLKKGASCHSRGVYCARVAGVQAGIADEAELYAEQLDKNMKERVLCNEMAKLMDLSSGCVDRKSGDDGLVSFLRNRCVV